MVEELAFAKAKAAMEAAASFEQTLDKDLQKFTSQSQANIEQMQQEDCFQKS